MGARYAWKTWKISALDGTFAAGLLSRCLLQLYPPQRVLWLQAGPAGALGSVVECRIPLSTKELASLFLLFLVLYFGCKLPLVSGYQLLVTFRK